MKAAIYLADGLTQVVLTSESEWEKNVLAQIEGKEVEIFRGGFYACQGGWIRESKIYDGPYGRPDTFGDRHPPDSLMLRINRTTETPSQPEQTP